VSKPATKTAQAPLGAEELAKLAAVDSPTVANIIELFGVRSPLAGWCNQSLKAVYPELPPIAGYVVTATLRAGLPYEPSETPASLADLIELGATVPGPAIAAFQDLDEPCRAVTFGEVMASSLKGFGFAGLITSGAGRDIEQVRRMRFPCWASSIVVSHGCARIVEVGGTIQVAGLSLRTGDLIHADGNGVVHVPPGIARGVVELIEPYLDIEREIIGYVGGTPTIAGYRAVVQKAGKTTQALKERAKALLGG
jgi:hypothetical protein